MKNAKHNVFKKLVIILIIAIMANFAVPTYSHADLGGDLFNPLFQLICGIGDLAIGFMQNAFVGIGDTTLGISKLTVDTPTAMNLDKNGNSTVSKQFQIYYSPGKIFSGTVPGLDINFINPINSSTEFKEKKVTQWNLLDVLNNNNMGMTADSKIFNGVTTWQVITAWDAELYVETPVAYCKDMQWEYEDTDGKKHLYLVIAKYSIFDHQSQEELAEFQGKTDYEKIKLLQQSEGEFDFVKIYEADIEEVSSTTESIAGKLQSTIASWYLTLRTIALVGLLSVLVYLGIKILLSSTAEDKAKYKKNIMDWLVAVCLLFVLHYIMSFTLTIAQEISKLFPMEGVDPLMSTLRNQIGENPEKFIEIFSQTVMYVALVILTVTFTIQYLKRVLYMAFFTIIAPLIALTYPIDKAKDGKAQAFDIWIKEYTYNSLIQVVHLLIYYIFVGSAISLATSNPLYAIVCIGFIIPAQKFVRTMFGFNKATTVGGSSAMAAAGGAMVMKAVNRIRQKPDKDSEAGKAKPRQKGGSGEVQAELGEGGASSTRTAESRTQELDQSAEMVRQENLSRQAQQAFANGDPNAVAQAQGASAKKEEKAPGTWAGINAVGKKYLGNKKMGRRALKLGAGLAGATFAGTIGMAAGVASGNFGNVAKYGAGGFAAGYMGGNALATKGINTGIEARDTFMEGAKGTKNWNNEKSDKEHYASQEWKDVQNQFKEKLVQEGKSPDEIREELDAFKDRWQIYRENGITDSDEIEGFVNMKDDNGNYIDPQMGAYGIRLAKEVGGAYHNDKVRKNLEERIDSGIGITDAEQLKKVIKLYHNG